MPGDFCILCGNSRLKATADRHVSYHRFPKNKEKLDLWLQAFQLSAEQIKSHSRVCSRHFRGGDAKNGPEPTLGQRFASPIKKNAPRAKRAKLRQVSRDYQEACSSRSVTSTPSVTPTPSLPPSPSPTPTVPPLTVAIGEQLHMDYQVHELPSECVPESQTPIPSAAAAPSENNLVNVALMANIESLEAENARLKKCLEKSARKPTPFSVDQIQHDDSLVSFYSGFTSYAIFLAFFEFLGPAVNKLNYWGSKIEPRVRQQSMKVNPIDQLLMTLMKLRLNLKVVDLAFRFHLSPAAVSRYITTWICFLYHQLKELDWMPAVEQVAGTLPPSFRGQFQSTYALIDCSEIFLETPSDLHMQSSTWSSYKHHNTAKFLIACTPNGCVSFISPLYVGSISDVELTRISGLLTSLKDKQGISIMADRGFTIRDMLSEIGVGLNIPPFMEGRQQMPAREVQEGRHIASLRIHVERAIGRMKTFSILKETLPVSLARLSNQIVCVCAFLSNFKPALVSSGSQAPEVSVMDADDYFEGLSDNDSADGSSDNDL